MIGGGIGLTVALFASMVGGSGAIHGTLPQSQMVPSFELRTVSTQAEMQTLYRKYGGKVCNGCRVQGFTATFGDGHKVVFIMPPKKVNDANTTTLGHEVLHVVLGNYHDEVGE